MAALLVVAIEPRPSICNSVQMPNGLASTSLRVEPKSWLKNAPLLA